MILVTLYKWEKMFIIKKMKRKISDILFKLESLLKANKLNKNKIRIDLYKEMILFFIQNKDIKFISFNFFISKQYKT